MKNVLKLIVLGGCAFVAVRTVGNPLMAVSSATSNKDHYKVEWKGAKGIKLYGSYTIVSTTDFTTPARVEQVNGVLPYQIEFNAPKQSIVSAAAMANNNQLTIKIFRNGAECGKEAITGSGAMPNKVCQ